MPALTPDDIARCAWEFPITINVKGADDLVADLRQECRAIVAAGHLAPLRVEYGDVFGDSYWIYQEPGRILTTLAWAWPYLAADEQDAVRKYVASELADDRFAPWGPYPMPRDVGARRERFPTDRAWGAEKPLVDHRPTVHTLYGLWLYGYRSGDWPAVQKYWDKIKTCYHDRAAEGNLYGTMGAHVAMVRMAEQFKDPATRDAAMANLAAQLAAGHDFAAVEENARSRPDAARAPYGPMYTSRKEGGVYPGWVFLNVSPEIARFMEANLPAALLQRHALGKRMYPFWWLQQAPYFTRWTGDESVGLPPEIVGMIAPLERWVVGADSVTLRSYLASCPTGTGDCYWLEMLVQAIEAHGRMLWIDVRKADFKTATAPAAAPGATITPGATGGLPASAVSPAATATATSTSTSSGMMTPGATDGSPARAVAPSATATPMPTPTLAPTPAPTPTTKSAPTAAPTR